MHYADSPASMPNSHNHLLGSEVAVNSELSSAVSGASQDSFATMTQQEQLIQALLSQQTPQKWSPSEIGHHYRARYVQDLETVVDNLRQVQHALESFKNCFDRINQEFQGNDALQQAEYLKVINKLEEQFKKNPDGSPDYSSPYSAEPATTGAEPTQDSGSVPTNQF